MTEHAENGLIVICRFTKHFWLEKILPEKEVLLNIPCKPNPMVGFWDSNNGVNETSANGLTENNIPASKV